MWPQLTIISLGWGVQSWTLAAMAALGKLPSVDYAIHADTTWEREETYRFAAEWTPWLEERGVKVVTVRSKRAHTVVHTAATNGNLSVLIPAFSIDSAGRQGQTWRACTGDWKIDPQTKEINRLLRSLGIKKALGTVERWLGISLDEWQRAKDSRDQYIVNRYPLLEKKMTRADCTTWLKAHKLPVPPKSACVFCPFHNRHAWEELKRAGGSDWERAVQIDTEIRKVRSQANVEKPIDLFIHPDRKPLAEAVQIPEDHGMKQNNLFDRVEDDDAATCDSGHCFL